MSRIEEALRRASADESAPAPPVPHDVLFRVPAGDDATPDCEYQSECAEPERSAPRSAPPAMLRDDAIPAIVADRTPVSDKVILSHDAEPVAIEQYRRVAATLHHVQLDRGLKTVMVASAIAGEGKTLTAVNVALTLSESFKRRVLLIDADLRRPSVHQVLKITNGVGLSDALGANEDEKLSLIEWSPYLSVLPAGRPNSDPMSGLASDRMKRIIEEGSERFDWIIIDTPPIGLMPDAKLLVEMINGVIFVVAAGLTPFREVERAVANIDREKILGVVLNRVIEKRSAYQYYNSYSSYYGADKSPRS
jgi:capsular exopolysaccharide synthesis family protein